MKIFFANVPYHVRDSDIKQIFEVFGATQSAIIITHKDTGKSKGFGFLEMPDEDQAVKAIKGLNGIAIGDRAIVVKPADGHDLSRKTGKRPRIKV